MCYSDVGAVTERKITQLRMAFRFVLWLLVVPVICSGGRALAQRSNPGPVRSQLEEQKRFALEQKKLDLEQMKFAAEKEHFERTFGLAEKQAAWTTLSIWPPLALAALTLAATLIFNGVMQRRAEDKARLLHEESEKQDRVLKAVEIAMNSPDSTIATRKAEALMTMFPGLLPENFVDTTAIEHMSFHSGRRLDLLNALAQNIDHKEDIITLYKAFWPGDKWVDEVRQRLSNPSNP